MPRRAALTCDQMVLMVGLSGLNSPGFAPAEGI